MWFQVIRYRIYFKQSSMKFIFLSSVVIWIKFCRCHLIYTKTFRLMKYCTVKQILDNFKLIENLFLIHCIILVQNNAVYKPQKHTLWFDLHRFKCNLYERFLLAKNWCKTRKVFFQAKLPSYSLNTFFCLFFVYFCNVSHNLCLEFVKLKKKVYA